MTRQRINLSKLMLRIGATLCLVALTMGLILFTASSYKGTTAKCATEGPYLPDATNATRLVQGSFAFFPLGRECTYVTGADGQLATATSAPLWPYTWIVYGTFAGGTVLIAGALATRKAHISGSSA